MPNKVVHTEPFLSGQQTNARDKGEPVRAMSRVSAMRNAGQPDPLKQALTKFPPLLPSEEHTWKHTAQSRPRGALYSPAGQFGRPGMGSEHKTRATGMGSHTSRPGGNPLGHNSNRSGGKSGYPPFTPRGGGKNV